MFCNENLESATQMCHTFYIVNSTVTRKIIFINTANIHQCVNHAKRYNLDCCYHLNVLKIYGNSYTTVVISYY